MGIFVWIKDSFLKVPLLSYHSLYRVLCPYLYRGYPSYAEFGQFVLKGLYVTQVWIYHGIPLFSVP